VTVSAGAVLVGLLIIAAVLLFASTRIIAAIDTARREATIRDLQVIFAPGIQAVQDDPRRFLTWYPLAQANRRLFPDAFKTLDEAAGKTFPFSREQVEEAHARWTAEWLSWERSHDGEYTLKTASLQEELARGGEVSTAIGRARLAALEREKLERYQERYQHYIVTAKALQAMAHVSSDGPRV
jgi:hypothetical protein